MPAILRNPIVIIALIAFGVFATGLWEMIWPAAPGPPDPARGLTIGQLHYEPEGEAVYMSGATEEPSSPSLFDKPELLLGLLSFATAFVGLLTVLAQSFNNRR
ncbi:MAG: hypothetical protein AAGF90_23525 [Pseudomonadota bacterium]